MATESHPVKCRGCHRTVLVAVSNLHPPCFRNFEEQAECPEVLARKRSNGEKLLLMMCSTLKQSFNEKFENAEVEPAAYEGGWRVVCRTPDDDQIFSPNHARRQAELWEGCGQRKLAGELRKAADEAERRRFRGSRAIGIPKPIAIIGFGVMALAIVSSVAWYLLMRESTQPIVGMTPAEANPQAASSATGEPLASQAVSAMPEQSQLKPINRPEMISLPGGTFTMGSSRDDSELPSHRVTIKPFE